MWKSFPCGRLAQNLHPLLRPREDLIFPLLRAFPSSVEVAASGEAPTNKYKICLTRSWLPTLKSWCFYNRQQRPNSLQWVVSVQVPPKLLPAWLGRHPELLHPLLSSTCAWASPGVDRATEAKQVKVECLKQWLSAHVPTSVCASPLSSTLFSYFK